MEMPFNNTLFLKGKEAFLSGEWKEAEYLFSASYKEENNQKALNYLLYTYLVQSNFDKILKIFSSKKFEVKGFGLYSVYWTKYLSGDLDEAMELLEKMMDEEDYFTKIFAIKELIKFKENEQLREAVKNRFKYFGLSYTFPIEEQRASMYLDYLSKRYHLAMIQAKSLLKEYPENPDVYLDYLEMCFEIGTEKTKKEALENELIRKMAKNDFRIMYIIAKEYYREKEYNLSKELLQNLVNIFRHNPIFYYNLGNIYFIKGNYIKAIENYLNATEFAPLFDKAFHNLGVSYYKIGEINKAIKSFERAISISKNPASIYNLSICYIEKKQYEAAYHYLNKIPNWAKDFKYSPYFLKEKIKDLLFTSLLM